MKQNIKDRREYSSVVEHLPGKIKGLASFTAHTQINSSLWRWGLLTITLDVLRQEDYQFEVAWTVYVWQDLNCSFICSYLLLRQGLLCSPR